MHVVLWRFRARAGREAEFESAYGADGAWAHLFRESEGYVGSELMRGSDGVYLTIDRWASEDAYRAFRRTSAARYDALDSSFRALTLEETLLGEMAV
jgi:heme-degrading monooxygenase HmoA